MAQNWDHLGRIRVGQGMKPNRGIRQQIDVRELIDIQRAAVRKHNFDPPALGSKTVAGEQRVVFDRVVHGAVAFERRGPFDNGEVRRNVRVVKRRGDGAWHVLGARKRGQRPGRREP
jgi:hypothetical protein